jgi:hypothetical protein
MRNRSNTTNRIDTTNRVNTANRINTSSKINTRSRINTVNRFNPFNMLSRFVDTQRIGSGVGSGIANTPNRFTIHGPITIRTTGTLSGITAVDIAAVVVDTPVVYIAAVVVEDTPVAVTPVVVTVAIGNRGNFRIESHQAFGTRSRQNLARMVSVRMCCAPWGIGTTQETGRPVLRADRVIE